MDQPVSGKLTRKQFIAVVYVGISVFLTLWAVQMTQAQVQWFTSADTLQPRVDNVTFAFSQTSPTGTAWVNASVENPSSNGAMKILDVYYIVFVDNSTLNGFSIQGSSQVANWVQAYNQTTIPSRGTLNLSANLTLMMDVVVPTTGERGLEAFLKATATQTRLVWVQIVINLNSTYGTLGLQSCFQMPNRFLPTCPAPRASVRGGGGGGGG